jgi:hypothetical protein
MTHAQKPDFVFRTKWTSLFKSSGGGRGGQSSRLLASRGVRISGSNAGYTMFCGSVKSTGYSLHSPVSPSLLLPCITVCHHISTGVYLPNVEMPHLPLRRYPVTLSPVTFQIAGDSTTASVDISGSPYHRCNIILQTVRLPYFPLLMLHQLTVLQYILYKRQ